jgi:ATP synthase F1 gamma subunit
MPYLKEQREQIADIESARYITGALRDIAALKLKELRKKYATNDTFYGELAQLYGLVWRMAQEGNISATRITGRGKLYVAYTTNKHFYGSINSNIIRELARNTSGQDECLIIGETGRQLWVTRAQKRRMVDFVSFADDMPTPNELELFLQRITSYEHVYVLYPGFTSVFRQDVKIVDVTFRPSDTQLQEHQHLAEFILEPDLLDMLAFFSGQVKYALFERMLLETQLAQVSARMVKMDTADQNAEALARRENRELRRAYTSFSSRRMLETLVGYIQWHQTKAQHIAQ